MSLRSGAKYVYSTDTQQVNELSEQAVRIKDSAVQLQFRLESHIFTKRLENKELLNFAVGVKRKCPDQTAYSPAKLWKQL